MAANNEELRLRIFMCFLNFTEKNRKITKMAQALGVEKYEMSRQVAERLARRMELAQNHLIYEGVPRDEARHAAMMLTLYCGDKTFEISSSSRKRCA